MKSARRQKMLMFATAYSCLTLAFWPLTLSKIVKLFPTIGTRMERQVCPQSYIIYPYANSSFEVEDKKLIYLTGPWCRVASSGDDCSTAAHRSAL